MWIQKLMAKKRGQDTERMLFLKGPCQATECSDSHALGFFHLVKSTPPAKQRLGTKGGDKEVRNLNPRVRWMGTSVAGRLPAGILEQIRCLGCNGQACERMPARPEEDGGSGRTHIWAVGPRL